MTDTYADRDVGQNSVLTGDGQFEALTAPLRGELTAHCYRMLGSVHDAEDQVQETYLRAWRAYRSFQGRSSVRTWMYKIATRTCLTALEQRQRRPLPTGLGAPSSDPSGKLEARPEVPWLEPLPDALVGHGNAGEADDPAGAVVTRDSVRLAFVAALQRLTPHQRAVLILRDVLAFSAAETADALDISVASANSALQRARARVGHVAEGSGAAVGELDDRERDLLAQYMRAIEQYDVDAVVRLLREDATWEMPPFPDWYSGAQAIATLIKDQCPAEGPGDLLMLPTSANGQPAGAGYLRDPAGVHRPFQLQVLTVETRGDAGPVVGHVTCFFDVSLFKAFGLPEMLPPGGSRSTTV
jgi:RNA polymerase sigma-70 factor (ECF subfamily)